MISYLFYRVRNAAYCIRKRFPKRMLLCDVSFKDIPASTQFNHPYGITIRDGVRLGENCVFASNVTIGQSRSEADRATIGNGVYFGTGSVVLGSVTIGDNAFIGANVLVRENVPDNAIYTGKRGNSTV